jgi:Cell wall hydrolyses involved in spore germination
MKKKKLVLIAMLIIMSVFCITNIFKIRIPSPIGKANLAEEDNALSTTTDALAKQAPETEIQSFSVNSSKNNSFDARNGTSEHNSKTSSEKNIAVTEAPDKTAGDGNKSTNLPSDTSAFQDAAAASGADSAASSETAQAVISADKDSVNNQKAEKVTKAKYADMGISIAEDFVNVRNKASENSHILGKLYKNSAATIIKEKGDWYYVKSGAIKGYVKSEFIKTGIPDKELVDKYATLSVSVTANGLNVRKNTSLKSERVAVIYRNENYRVVKTKGNWIKISIPKEHTTGFIKTEFAKLHIEFKEAVSKAEEEKFKQLEAAEQVKRATEIHYENGVGYTGSELKLLACLIHAEAGSQSYECKLAVANVVLNRVASPKYASSIKSVIFQHGQFSVVPNGSLQRQLNSFEHFSSASQRMSIKAARDALAGANNIGSRLYFHSYMAAVRKGYDHKVTSVKLDGLLFW